MEVVEKGGYLMVVTANGFGKRTALDEYPLKTRGTGGIKTIDVKHIGHIGRIVAARVVQNEDEITLITSGGLVLRQRVKGIRPSGRATRGVRMMDILNGDSLAAMARIVESDLIKVEVEEGEAVPLEENSVPLPEENDVKMVDENEPTTTEDNGDEKE